MGDKDYSQVAAELGRGKGKEAVRKKISKVKSTNGVSDPDEELATKLEADAEAVAEDIDAYYDTARKEYSIRESTSVYHSLSEGQFKRVLRFRRLSSALIPRRHWSQLDIVIRHLQTKKFVNYVGPLSGRDCGYYLENGTPFLVTTSPRIIQPSPGKWETLSELFENLFWGQTEPFGSSQKVVFYGWLQVAYNALVARKFQPGQALAFAGAVEAGKSLTQRIITHILGGRSAKAALWLQERTDFNSELFGVEHLMLEDENASTRHDARVALGGAIKNITANQQQPCHAKGRDIVNLNPWWRLTISLNDRADRMHVLPSLDEDIGGKIILLQASVHPMPMPAETSEERTLFWNQLISELPAFLHWLINDFRIPNEWRNTRFGILGWHHPTLAALLEELSAASAILELIDQLKPWGLTSTTWEGTALELRTLLFENQSTRRDAEKLLSYTNACGQYLNDLARRQPPRVKAFRDQSRRWYEVLCPPSFSGEPVSH
jgi:hypothetical protein